jgi:uncharacterized protein YfbU (UPF0304 family)
MNFTDKLLNMFNNHKKNKIDRFIKMTKEQFLVDIEETAKIYSRNKGKEGYTVVKLTSGMFAVVDKFKDIVYKHEDVHYCKVECLMLIAIKDGTLAMFANKL